MNNGKQRRLKKDEDKAGKPRIVRKKGPTATQRRLRLAISLLDTKAQYEECVEQSSNKDVFRRMTERWLRPGIPCCGRAALAKAQGQPLRREEHHPLCPESKLVTLH